MRIVLTVRENSPVMVGIGDEGKDPMHFTGAATLDETLALMPDCVRQFEEARGAAPLSPAFDAKKLRKKPEPKAAQPAPAPAGSGSSTSSEAPKPEPEQAQAAPLPEPVGEEPAAAPLESSAGSAQSEPAALEETTTAAAENVPPAQESAHEPARSATETAPPEASKVHTAGNGGGWVYKLADGRGPFESVHDALRAMGIPQKEIDDHKYWHRHDRLPKKLAERIEKVPA